MREAQELRWEARLSEALKILGKDTETIEQERKAAPWKVAIAVVLKERFTCTNGWIVCRLAMDMELGVSRYVTELKGGSRPPATEIHHRLTAKIK